ncbi:transcription repressor OFP13-like [Hibiscus syriacus]|uniref:transcription repressor OFP13-like n=1 Tax=Hibiscus syriacus TaxID=106335 RepID=UPI0019249354|nr:transcription repressor OFP13-like [Hibiscus syriacus]
MKFPAICKKSKAKGSWKLSLFNPLKAISFISKPKTLKHSTSWSQLSKDSGELLDVAIEALRSNRLFFEPDTTSSILEAARFPFKDCVALALETVDPYMDFRVSMEEIVEACELKEQEHLEELLGWYLKMNRKKNHGFIVGAFIDMFVSVNSSSSCSSSSSSCFISVSSSASAMKAFHHLS